MDLIDIIGWLVYGYIGMTLPPMLAYFAAKKVWSEKYSEFDKGINLFSVKEFRTSFNAWHLCLGIVIAFALFVGWIWVRANLLHI